MTKVAILFKNQRKVDLIKEKKANFTDWEKLQNYFAVLSKDLYYVEDKDLTQHLREQGAAIVT